MKIPFDASESPPAIRVIVELQHTVDPRRRLGPIVAKIDTAASISAVPIDCAIRLGLVGGGFGRIVMADAVARPMPLFRTHISLEDVHAKSNMLVIGRKSEEALLGRDFINALCLCTDGRADRFWIASELSELKSEL